MTQETTFRVLKRIPYDQIQQHLDDLPKYLPVFNFNGTIFHSQKNEIVQMYTRMRCLENLGWSLEEYVPESEKRNIIEAIDQYNKQNTFPSELVDRAKEFFPNAKFTQAKIELE